MGNTDLTPSGEIRPVTLSTPTERLAGVEAVPQPSPGINPGGDCFACATLAIVRHWWPETAADVTVADVVEWWRTQPVYGKDDLVVGNHIHVADRSLRNMPEPFRLDVVTDPFVPLIDDHSQMHSPVWGAPHYSDRIEAYLAAGFVGLTSIRFAPDAPHMLSPKPAEQRGGSGVHRDYWNASTDHIVLIDGWRTYVRGDEEPFGTHVDDLHIVCSVKGGYWIEDRELLRWHGGMFIWWCRPRLDKPWVRAEGDS